MFDTQATLISSGILRSKKRSQGLTKLRLEDDLSIFEQGGNVAVSENHTIRSAR